MMGDAQYLAGWTAGALFVQRYQHVPKLLLHYAKWHMKRYRQTDNDRGFVDAINSAFGA